MIDIILTCEKCGRKAHEKPWEGNTRVFDVEALLERMVYQNITEDIIKNTSILLCPDCTEKYDRILDKCNDEKKARVMDFLKE